VATALYRRYRPESFAEVIGQDHVTTPLRRALRAGRVGHAYLFSGPRGCGKTTSARILARCLNCAQGPTDTPCGTCDSCRDLARGGAGSLDVVEIDAASHGGVDDARELRERASFAPVRDRYKVFIIDEAHMVTSAGFNALLKLVEEPPDHVKFVFATTEPDKVIGTIRSRTHHYPFRLIPPQVLGPYLDEVCAAEGVQVGDGVMPLVVRAGGGSARDSMSVLDQLMAGAGEDGLDFPTAIALLGFTDTALLDQAVTAVAERDAASLYSAVEHVLATGHEPRRFVEDLLERMRDLIVLAAVPDRGADLLPQVPAGELERMAGQASQFAPADLSLCGDLVHETLSTMSGATSPRLHLELLAARLVLRDERASLSAADGAGAQGAAVAGGAPTNRGGQERSGAQAPAGGGGREEARRIAQERAEAARQARGGGRQAPAQGGQAAPTGQAAPAGQEPSTTPDASASAAQPAAPVGPGTTESSAAPAGSSGAQGGEPQGRAQDPQQQDGRGAPAQESTSRQNDAAASWGAIAAAGADRDEAPQRQDAAPQAQGGAQQPPADAQQVRGDAQPPQAGAQPTPAGAQPTQGGASAGGGLDADEVRGHWSAILDELQQIRRPSWALISQNAHVNGAHGTTLVLGFRTDGLVSAFHRGTAAENLVDAVRRIMHTDITVEAVVGEDPGPGAGAGGSGGGGPAAGGPGAPGAGGPRTSGPNGPGGGGQGGPGAGETPRQSGGAWGDAAPAMPPRDASSATEPSRGEDTGSGSAAPAGAEQTVSVGQRASERAMAAAARAARSAPAAPSYAPPEDFPPEPDDPYPPDPEEYGAPAPQAGAPHAQGSSGPQGDGPAQAQGRRWSDAIPDRSSGRSDTDGGNAPAARGGAAGQPDVASAQREDASAPGGAAASTPSEATAGGAASGGAPLEVEDEGRDSLPAEEPRTFGQNALRRALAEGRVVRSLPAAHRQQAGAAPGADQPGDAAVESPASAGEDDLPGGFGGQSFAEPVAVSPVSPASPSPAGSEPPASPSAGQHPAAAQAPAAAQDTAAAPHPADAAPGAGESATARAAASWGEAAAVTGTVPGRQAPAPSAAEAPRSGAALVREAALASRAAGQGLRRARREPEAAPEVDVDPTGGATRDDEDAVVATRNGREVIEKMLGGKVLEVIDETGPR
jgi:DNA polymerase-3 subunit gamma/tau